MPTNLFFTADTHFFHRRLAEMRGFADVAAMNEALVGKWNAVVAKNDRVYHLGDVSLGKPDETAELLARLNGVIYLVKGNHDKTVEHAKCLPRFVWQKDLCYLEVEGQKMMLCHYAMRTWRSSHHGSWMLHGHSHSSLPELDGYKSFDVGVDCWGLAPVSFEAVKEKMATKTFVPVDHHFEKGGLV